MGLKSLHATLIGVRPLLMHNGRLADPTDPMTQELKRATKKQNKTDADHAEIKRLEWLAGLYRDESGKIAVTEDMVLGAMVSGAKASKKGKQALAGVLGAKPFFALKYDGPSDPIELFKLDKFCDYRLAVVSRSRVMRARPRFNQWSVEIELLFDDAILDERGVMEALKVAGATVGLGDFRPRFGRFTVEARA